MGRQDMVKVLIAGDFCPQKRVASLFEKNEFKEVLGDVINKTSQVDYSVLNFECPITRGGERPIFKQGPNLTCTENGMEAIKWAGFDAVTLANNHFFDYGLEGVKNTLEALRTSGLDYVGGGTSLLEASQVLYKTISNRKLAIINCCEHEFSIATETSAGSNPLNPIKQYYSIQEAKTASDYVIVIVHGGHEHYQLPSPRMQELYRFFVDSGADAVINHHQHCYSGYEVYHDKPIFYGLGNFCFDNDVDRNGIWNYGYLVKLILSEKISFVLYPYVQCGIEPRVVMLEDHVFDEKISELNEVISNPIKLKEASDNYYKTCQFEISKILEPSNNRIYLGLKRRGWLPSFINNERKLRATNYVCCESHRDKLIYFLENGY